MSEPTPKADAFLDDCTHAFDEWRALFTKGKNEGKLSSKDRKRIRVLSKRLAKWFN